MGLSEILINMNIMGENSGFWEVDVLLSSDLQAFGAFKWRL